MSAEEKQERRLKTAAVIASRVEVLHMEYEHHENGKGVAWTESSYDEPQGIAERALSIADCLIALVDSTRGLKP